MRIDHGIAPVYDRNARVLILGSFPSVRSREEGFFYGNPQNRFWRMLADLTACPVPGNTDEKKRFLLRNGIALWDVVASCEIDGSSDASIRDVAANDLTPILETARIRAIAANGSTAARLYRRYLYPRTGIPALTLPSTSPANASWSLSRLEEAWSVILPLLGRPHENGIGDPD